MCILYMCLKIISLCLYWTRLYVHNYYLHTVCVCILFICLKILSLSLIGSDDMGTTIICTLYMFLQNYKLIFYIYKLYVHTLYVHKNNKLVSDGHMPMVMNFLWYIKLNMMRINLEKILIPKLLWMKIRSQKMILLFLSPLVPVDKEDNNRQGGAKWEASYSYMAHYQF